MSDYFNNSAFGLSEDLMDVGTRVDMDVESIPDCDSREDFLRLWTLEQSQRLVHLAMNYGASEEVAIIVANRRMNNTNKTKRGEIN